jgi:hypothetical protein
VTRVEIEVHEEEDQTITCNQEFEMSNDLTEMTPTQLRELISQAKAQLKEVELPGKRWFMQLSCVRELMQSRAIVVEAPDADAALAAAKASADDLSNESDDWGCAGDEVIGFDVDIVEEEFDLRPDYRIDEDGKLEEVE